MTAEVVEIVGRPEWTDPVTGDAGWEGGVRVTGTLVEIPGRTIDHEHLDDARQHARAVLAAVAMVEARTGRKQPPEDTAPYLNVVSSMTLRPAAELLERM